MHTDNLPHSIIGHHVNSTRFDFNRKTGEFVAEISMIQHGGINLFAQLYNDAADQGFVMISAQTQQAVDFYLSDTQRDDEGDVKFWEFTPSTRAVRCNDRLAGVKVIVLND